MSEKRYVEIDGKICLVEELSQEDILNHLNDLLGENEQLQKELEKVKLLNESLGLVDDE